MTTTYLGSLTLGAALPGGAAVAAAATGGINAALPTLTDRLTALLAFSPTPVDFASRIAMLEAMIAGLKASMTLGLTPPSVVGQLADIAALIASLRAQIAGLQAHLAISMALQSAFGAAGVHALAFEGPAASFGPEVMARLAEVPGISPADHAHAIALLTTVPATWAAMAQLFKVAP